MKNIIVLVGLLFVSSVAQAQELQSYIQEAEANNPEVQAFELRHSISKEKVEEVDALPNTEVSAGVFVSEPETRTGAQKARFSIKQMLPWFGTITARENYASSLAEVDYLDIAITKRKLRLSVSQSYYRLFAITEKQKVLAENIQLLRTYERLALTSVEVGNASAVDVLRLQIRQNNGGCFKIDMNRARFRFELCREHIRKQHSENAKKPRYACANSYEGEHIKIPSFDAAIGAFKKHPRGIKHNWYGQCKLNPIPVILLHEFIEWIVH